MPFFNDVGFIRYEGPESKNPLAFKHYDPGAVLGGKSMREHLKFSMSFWHTLCGEGADMFGAPAADKSFGGKTPREICENRIFAAFELMDKLGLEYFCFHDKDIADEGCSLKEFTANLEKSAELIKSLMKEHGKKLLWGTANLFSHPRYSQGAATSCSPDVFAAAAAQVKNALDVTAGLGGSGYVFWGGREGYETLLNTDMGFELDNMARFLGMAAEYGRKIGFKGDFYIEPKPKEPMKHQYDFDAAAVFAFLKKYGLEKEFRLNIEANHATLAGHTFGHELCAARVNGLFGSIDANQGDLLLGWDTDEFPVNVYDAAFAMLEVLRAGGFTNGGLNFDAKTRRPSSDMKDIFYGYIAGMDTFALGLKIAFKIVEDGRIDKFVSDRYSPYKEGIGAKIVSGGAGLEELWAYALANENPSLPESGRQEFLFSIVNNIMFG